jgi:hypothetical protein
MTVAADVCSQLDARLAAAEAALAADRGASPVTAAVLAEFRRKLTKTRSLVERPDEAGHREALFELEQAADSAKAAILADAGQHGGPATRSCPPTTPSAGSRPPGRCSIGR